VPSIDECSLGPVHALLAQHDPGLQREPDAVSPPGAVRHAHPKVNAPELQRLDPVPEGVGQAPLVDFCNQYNPRARPRDHLNPGPRRGGCPLLRSCAPRRDRNLARPGVRLRAPLGPHVRLRARLGKRDRVAPSLRSRRALRPALASERLQPRFHGPGAGRLSPPGTSRRDSSRRELRPNPIGSDTSCRELVAPPAGKASDAGSRCTCWKHGSPVRLRAHLASPLSRCPP